MLRKITIITLLLLAIAGIFYLRGTKVEKVQTETIAKVPAALPLIIDISAAG